MTEEKTDFGQWGSFKKLVLGVSDVHVPTDLYIYPKFAVLNFLWEYDATRMFEFLRDMINKDVYAGVHAFQRGQDVAIVDATSTKLGKEAK